MLSLPNGVPSEDTFERVFKRIRPEELENCLRHYGHSILSDLAQKQIVVDGKKQRGAAPTSRGNRGLCLLNVWVSENRFCLAQSKVWDKSNEITAAPQVLSDIDIEDAVASIDALGTQREIAELIVAKKGHYLLALKSNQRSCSRMLNPHSKYTPGTRLSTPTTDGSRRADAPYFRRGSICWKRISMRGRIWAHRPHRVHAGNAGQGDARHTLLHQR